MKCYWGVCFLIIIDCTLKWAESICVLDSDFGFNLNCGFKKSGLFRVRNLGGVKGYVGLGFSVGDELGFGDSLSNTDSNQRRSVASARSANITGANSTKKRADNLRRSVNPTLLPVPPFKPIPPASYLSSSASPRNFSVVPARITVSNIRQVPAPTLIAAIPVIPPSFQSLPASITKSVATTTLPPPRSQVVGVQVIPAPIAFQTSLDAARKHFQVRKDTQPASSDTGVASNTLSLRQLGSAPSTQDLTSQTKLDIKAALPNAMSSSIKLLAQATNLSEDAIAAAIAIRQQQLLQQQQQAELALATSTTTKKPLDTNIINKYPLASVSKVMNAPREYYPVGYDKNFDDNFASRVELPDTSFYCGDQKHFPGLYADEDLGCMVFHVCAFTDDGLIMKSFLCPESTLFDQSILKCNWWFYVDCKSSKKLYDSNIPISKSYQLMKALAFFSSYNKQ